MEEFYDYLRSQFSALETAKDFMWRWANEMNEELPGFGLISSRSLSAHVSAILEGKLKDDTGTTYMTNYLASKYGSDLYFAAWGSRPDLAQRAAPAFD